MLVARRELKLLRGLLRRLGFVELPGWGYAPHHFFVAYDVESASWLKLDVVTAVSFGSPIHALPSSLASNCLQNRRHCGLTYVPSPEDELITMLLHCDLVYVAAGSQLKMPFTKLALCPELVSSYLLPRMIGMPRAMEMLLLGDAISAERAVEWGLANEVLAAEAVLPRVASDSVTAKRLTSSTI